MEDSDTSALETNGRRESGNSRRDILSVSQRFKQTLIELFSLLEDIIAGLHAEKLCQVTPDAVRFTCLLVSAYNPEVMMESFIQHHSHWDHIVKHNTKYVMTEFDEMLRDNGITADTKIIKLPFSVYASLTSNSGKYGTDQSQWPINQQDLDEIWNFFEAMVGISCNHIHQSKRSNTAPKYYYEVNISEYSRMLNFKLG